MDANSGSSRMTRVEDGREKECKGYLKLEKSISYRWVVHCPSEMQGALPPICMWAHS